MKVIPVLTEKSLENAKDGIYTFWVGVRSNKHQVKGAIEKVFNVHVTRVRSVNYKGLVKRNLRGVMQKVKPKKKVFVTLKKDEKIDLFEEKKKK